MKVKSYKSINNSTTSGKNSFLKNLISYYDEKPVKFNLTNKDDDNFLYFQSPINKIEKEFEAVMKKCLARRSTDISNYLSSGYIISEINSSLRAEGVHSSRKIVDQVLKIKKSGEKLENNEISKLVSNYYDSILFILGNKEINERNIYTLYSILTSDLNNLIEDGSKYRQKQVSVGEDIGINPKIIESKMKQLINFIKSDFMENKIQTKAIIAHYIFENIHPYYDYNGRMGRLIYLWVTFNRSINEFWKITYLSEAVYAYKKKFDTAFRKITKAKKSNANIDLTFFINNMYEILIDHSLAYIKMKDLVSTMKKSPSRHLRLFIIDLLCEKNEFNRWLNITEFKKRYYDYSKTVYDRTLKEIKESNLFEIREGKPIMFRLKDNNK